MTRGTLRVLLGAAPGVGKTYAMLQEGHQLAAEGRDVVLALVETHDREPTAALVDGLEMVPRRGFTHRGVQLSDMDLAAVLARAPEIALVDELAHTNVGTGGNEKRWQDVHALLDAGIDVISTVNVQHIESLGDVVYDITGAAQRETIPDAVLRAADAIELIDLTPQGLRARLGEGLIYPPGRIDAALSNYFRLGNLTALREIALLWLADEVDSALEKYRAEHGISARWETRERVMVALTGGEEGETLLRRGARIAARSSGGELSAVHVTAPDGLLAAHPKVLADQRLLVERLGGTYHQVIGEDVPAALVEFARASNATQLVIGASRRSKLATALTGPGIGAGIVRLSGDIDVHMVNHAAAASGHRLPRSRGALTRGRTLAGFVLALLGGPLLTWFLTGLQASDDSITVDVLAYQLLVVIVALVGGLFPAVFAALLSGLTLDFFFINPLYTITIAEPTHLVVLILYILIAVLVSVVVDQAARRHRAATRSAAESALLATVSGSVLRGADALEALVNQTCEAFSLRGVRLVESNGEVHSAGTPGPGPADTVLPVGGHATLELHGRDLPASDRRALAAIVSQLEAVLDFRAVSAAASELAPLAEADRVRSALLQAVGHDLRRPLTAATTAVTSLRSTEVAYSAQDRAELLETADESLHALSVLVTDLLDVSRLQAGMLGVNNTVISVEDVLLPALEEAGLGPADIEVDVPQDLDQLTADPVLMQRIVVNLLLNALRYGAGTRRPILAASQFAGRTEVRVIDFGPGIPAAAREAVFVPFQRHGDTDNLTGLGLGLALSRGFAEGMGGSLAAEDTPGGGLTMVLSLPAAPEPTEPTTPAEPTGGASA
ncbi:DUF4118 domain-containing protein [Paeniglutamicibacter kerguelensis]|uniref:histidine kinase n=1 Tax=Paeniglutamicibacter kerguelensis TaxID=254788 RepID=A0ABS4XIQ3_9MICC|nr:DUF4118 domain-containing protein [Paeniglutamicibacter kerguelensis]MBP2387549.1 two-component system sensor histidine kinase KdpD [Paeniglutamicibacter kerguelensis]